MIKFLTIDEDDFLSFISRKFSVDLYPYFNWDEDRFSFDEKSLKEDGMPSVLMFDLVQLLGLFYDVTILSSGVVYGKRKHPTQE